MAQVTQDRVRMDQASQHRLVLCTTASRIRQGRWCGGLGERTASRTDRRVPDAKGLELCQASLNGRPLSTPALTTISVAELLHQASYSDVKDSCNEKGAASRFFFVELSSPLGDSLAAGVRRHLQRSPS